MLAARIATLLVMVCVSTAFGEQMRTETSYVYQPRQLSLSEYVSELDHLSKLANESDQKPEAAEEALSSLRGGWRVAANSNTFAIETDWIFDQFERLQKKADEQTRTGLINRLNEMKADAEAFQQRPPDSTSARAALAQILARSEFNSVHGPTWLDRLKYRILSWIFRMLSHAFGSSAVPTVGRAFVWILVAIAVVVLAWYVYRTIKLNARMESVVPQGLPVSAKQWRVWMSEAEAAAAEGRWRDAVHLAYWGGISFLEGSGMWKPDQARTPREYLRLLPTGSQYRGQLSALTRNLEVTWYGNQVAGPETFAETLTLLEALGCRQA